MKKKEPKYCHYVTVYFVNGTAVLEILNDIKKYETRTQVKDLTDFVKKENGLEVATLSNIISVKNI